ncbi:MAG: NACHT domain-containing protein, partial [Microcoleus sp. SIO2G3]|nr:NACHT domain-containing protein [Microcoleus sp. SIO2G3]
MKLDQKMAVRSLRASAEGIQIIRKAIKRDGWKQEELKEELGLKTRQPITRLLRGEAIERPTFEELCHLLEIEVQDVAVPEAEESQPNPEVSIDSLVQEVRDRIQPLIKQACGTMRVLDMSYPIGLNDIYTDVNILERITSRRGLEWTEMMREAGREQFDRFCLGDVREERVPALEAVERFDKLMILGKPGAGKTTFLKRLAMQCIGDKFMADRVPVFVTLKEFAEADRQPSLLEYLDRWAGESLVAIVQAGRAMILLDGLDEVREVDSDRVLQQIKAFSRKFAQNCFVITCRIA